MLGRIPSEVVQTGRQDALGLEAPASQLPALSARFSIGRYRCEDVELAGRLVGEDQVSVADEHPGARDALPLAT